MSIIILFKNLGWYIGDLWGMGDASWLFHLAHSDKIPKKVANTCRQTLNVNYHIHKNFILWVVWGMDGMGYGWYEIWVVWDIGGVGCV